MNIQGIKKLLLSLGLTFGGTVSVFAQQNIQFTQYIFNSLSVNPAYAGYKEEWFAQMALRSQWSGIDGAPRTGQVSIDGVLDPAKRMGLGLQITADKLGPQTANSAYANYAYRLQLDNEDTQRLSFGIGVGFTQYGLDGNMLMPVDAGDQTIATGKTSSMIPDARFGIYYYNPKWYIGASVMDLFAGDYSNDIFRWSDNTGTNIKRKRHYYLIAGTLFEMSQGVKLRPSVMVKEDFKGPTNIDLNAMFIFENKIWIGGTYRTGLMAWDKDYSNGQEPTNINSVSAVAQFYVSDRFRIGYSYDHVLNRLGSVENGSHEITIGLTFPQKSNRLLSPRFF